MLPGTLDDGFRYITCDQDTMGRLWAETDNFLVSPQAVDSRQLIVEDDQVRHKRFKYGLRRFDVGRDTDLRCTPAKEGLKIFG